MVLDKFERVLNAIAEADEALADLRQHTSIGDSNWHELIDFRHDLDAMQVKIKRLLNEYENKLLTKVNVVVSDQLNAGEVGLTDGKKMIKVVNIKVEDV